MNRWLLAPLITLAPGLGIRSEQLGQAMLALGLDTSWRGTRTLANSELKELSGESLRAS